MVLPLSPDSVDAVQKGATVHDGVKLTVWLYFSGTVLACIHAVGVAFGWLPTSALLNAACLGGALLLITAAGIRHRARPGDASPLVWLVAAPTDDLGDIIFVLDVNGNLVFLNPAWKTIMRIEPKDSLGTPLLRHVHPGEQMLNRERILTVMAGRAETCRYETRLIRGNGEPVWVEVRLYPRSDTQRRIVGITGVMADIDAAKRAQDALRAQERWLSTLLGHLPCMVFRGRNDRRWSMEFVSDGCYELVGVEARDLINQQAYGDLIHPRDRASVWNIVQRSLAARKSFHLRYRILPPNDASHSHKWVEERSRGVFASDGTLLAIEGFIYETDEVIEPTDLTGAAHRLRRR